MLVASCTRIRFAARCIARKASHARHHRRYRPGVNVQLLGLVRGNIVTSKNVGRDLMAGFKAMAGGEIKTYTDMTNEARTIAEQRMVAQAQAMGADAVVAMRFSSEAVMDGATEMLAYGTAVKFV